MPRIILMAQNKWNEQSRAGQSTRERILTHTHTLENRMCIVYARHTEPRHQQNPKREKSSTLTTDNKTNPKNHGDYIYDYTCEWSTVVWIV